MLSACALVRPYQNCEHAISKANEPIMTQVGTSRTSCPRGRGMKRSTLAFKRSKVKITRGRRYIWSLTYESFSTSFGRASSRFFNVFKEFCSRFTCLFLLNVFLHLCLDYTQLSCYLLSYIRKRCNNNNNNNSNNNNVAAGTDSETALRDAFVMFDEEKKGKLAEE